MINSLTHPEILKPMLIFTYHSNVPFLRSMISICKSRSNMSRKVFIYEFSAHINTISKTSVSIIKWTLKEQSSQYIHVSQKTYQNIKGL